VLEAKLEGKLEAKLEGKNLLQGNPYRNFFGP